MSSLPPPVPPTSPGHDRVPQAPPGYVPYGTPSWTPPFARVGGMAKAILILLAVCAAVQIVLLPVIVAVRGKAEDYVDGRTSQVDFEDAHAIQVLLEGLLGAVSIAIFVLTIIWMYRLAQNHRSLGRPSTRWSPGWAVGGWFTPPRAVFVIPWLMFRELWKGSDPENRPNDPAWRQRPVSPLPTVWWVIYGLVPIASIVIDVMVTSAGFDDESSRELASTLVDVAWVDLGLGVAGLAAVAVYAALVHQLTRRQQFLTGER